MLSSLPVDTTGIDVEFFNVAFCTVSAIMKVAFLDVIFVRTKATDNSGVMMFFSVWEETVRRLKWRERKLLAWAVTIQEHFLLQS